MKHNKRRRGQKRKSDGSRDGRKKKVLVVTSVASMVSQFLLPDIRLLQEMGYEVHVMCNFKKGNTCGPMQLAKLERKLRGMHAVRHHWDCPRGIGCGLQCMRAFWQLWRVTGRQDFCLIHCHSPIGGALARLAAHGRGIRVVYTAHGFHFYKGAPVKNWLLYYPVEKLLSYWTDALITVNREDYRFAAGNLAAGSVYHIPGVGIDTSCLHQLQWGHIQMRKGAGFTSQRREDAGLAGWEIQKQEAAYFHRKYHIPPGAKVLLSVGELNRGKNHKAAIRALAGLSGKDVYYLICGQGRLKKELRRYAGRLGVAGRVRLPGYQENIQRIYPHADIFVFPSLREGMPVALMEAMAAGLPCVVSDIRGNRELISDMYGGSGLAACSAGSAAGGASRGDREQIRLRFSPEDPKQLVQTLERLLADPQLRRACGERNQRKIQGYSREAVLQKMRGIYQDMEA